MEHVKKECRKDCDNPSCNTCNLFTCTVCACSECELATECPGEIVIESDREKICAGKLDYRDGVWWERWK